MKNKHYRMRTAADVKAERVRLESLVAEKEEKLKGEVMEIKNKFNPIPGITSLFNSNRETKSTRAVVDTGVNFLIGKVITKRLGFLPAFVTPFVSKTISEQVMKLNLKPYVIDALDWVIEKTDDKPEIEKPVVFTPETALPERTAPAQPIVPKEHVEVTY